MSSQLANILVQSGALKFGSFTTKSGRSSPYFINWGHLCRGRDLSYIAGLYADALNEHFGDDQYCLFGPAYKGIPLVCMAAEAGYRKYQKNYRITYNRKEKKDHGEGGVLIGHQFEAGDNIVVVEDVLTGGTSVRESIQLLKAHGANLAGILVGMDRQEKGLGTLSTKTELERDLGVPVVSLLNLDQLIGSIASEDFQGKSLVSPEIKEKIVAYRTNWGGESLGSSV